MLIDYIPLATAFDIFYPKYQKQLEHKRTQLSFGQQEDLDISLFHNTRLRHLVALTPRLYFLLLQKGCTHCLETYRGSSVLPVYDELLTTLPWSSIEWMLQVYAPMNKWSILHLLLTATDNTVREKILKLRKFIVSTRSLLYQSIVHPCALEWFLARPEYVHGTEIDMDEMSDEQMWLWLSSPIQGLVFHCSAHRLARVQRLDVLKQLKQRLYNFCYHRAEVLNCALEEGSPEIFAWWRQEIKDNALELLEPVDPS